MRETVPEGGIIDGGGGRGDVLEHDGRAPRRPRSRSSGSSGLGAALFRQLRGALPEERAAAAPHPPDRRVEADGHSAAAHLRPSRRRRPPPRSPSRRSPAPSPPRSASSRTWSGIMRSQRDAVAGRRPPGRGRQRLRHPPRARHARRGAPPPPRPQPAPRRPRGPGPPRASRRRSATDMTDELRFARDGLRAAALTLSREVETQPAGPARGARRRHGLRPRHLRRAGDAPVGLCPGRRPPSPRLRAALLLNRRA